jgi:GGDEF domain-containing protein
MERTSWNARTWLRKLAWYLHDDTEDISFEHALYPEQQFREELAKEQLRAERSGKALLLMQIDTEAILGVTPEKELAETVGAEVNNAVRETDICGRMKEGVLVGVILTEIEPDKIDAAQVTIATKVRKKLRALLGEEMANRLPVTFNLVHNGSAGVVPGASDMPGVKAAGPQRLTLAGKGDQVVQLKPYRTADRSR